MIYPFFLLIQFFSQNIGTDAIKSSWVSQEEYKKKKNQKKTTLPFILFKAYYTQASSDVGFASYLLVLKMYKIRLLKCKDTDGPYGRELSRVL